MKPNTRVGAAALVGALLVSLPAAAQPQRPTLQQLMSAPFAADLVAGPAGKVAWVENVLGVRNIWMAGPPDYKGRQITHYSADDGMRMVQLAFTPDGGSIAFVRGGNQRGTRLPGPPNPMLLPEGAREEVWIVPTAGGEPSRIDEGIAPTVSPRGDLLIYLKKDQIWGAPVRQDAKGAVVGQPRQLIHDRGAATSLRWSPKGDRLAFVSLREEHSFVGVYGVDAHSLLFLDPSTDHDEESIWSPDGDWIAFIRIASAPGEATGGAKREAAQPWSIRVADARTGAGREVWRATKGVGSAFWNFLGNDRQLFWGAGNRIAFPWERTGWVHLYSVSVDGGDAVPLTSGEFEVEHVTMAADGRELFIASNQGDLDRRHLWRVSVGSGPARPVTSGTGMEYWPVLTLDDGVLTFLSTGARAPPQVEMVRMRDVTSGAVKANDRHPLAPGIAPKDFPANALVEPQPVVFPATDGLKIHGQLFLPPSYNANQRYPAVVYSHGGPQSQQVLGYNYIQVDYYQKHYALNQYLANQGYIVLSVNYRSGTGYGLQFREAIGRGASGASEVQDVIGAGQYLRGRSDVDRNRIGLWGGSYGGYMTAMGLARASDLFAAGVDFHGVHAFDANLRFSPFSPLDAAQREQVRLTARKSSPIGNVDTWRSPVLLIHGDDDRNVPFVQSIVMAAALRERGVEVEELVLPNEEHSFLRHASWLRTFQAAAHFFDRKLKNRPPFQTSATNSHSFVPITEH